MSNGHRGMWDDVQRAQDLMTVKEAAAYLHVHASTIYRLLKAHRLPGAFRVGYDWRVSRAALDAVIQNHTDLTYK